jgi:hypothetical protein
MKIWSLTAFKMMKVTRLFLLLVLVSQAEQPSEQVAETEAPVQANVEQSTAPAEQSEAAPEQESADGVQEAEVLEEPAKPMSIEEEELLRRDSVMRSSVSTSSGERIEVPERGFSIVPPEGWEVHRDYPGTTLMFQIPKREAGVYQRTIHVNAMNGARAMDDMTAKEFEGLIVQNFTKNSAALVDFKIRNYVFVEIPTGHKAVMYYSEFNLAGEPMMQVHMLVSSADRHFLMTYTDLAKNFDGGSDSPYLNTAWQSMTSIDVGTQSPGRYTYVSQVIGGVVGFIALFTAFAFIRRRRASAQYKSMADDMNEVSDAATSHDAPMTKHESWHSQPKSTNLQSLHEEEMSDKWNIDGKNKVG